MVEHDVGDKDSEGDRMLLIITMKTYILITFINMKSVIQGWMQKKKFGGGLKK
jgi:hypothetical protein